ncbi:MAG: RHS repeat protein, partial [Oscillospiraceae bacterium]|nr:RHS repeat protein [Oscillospiraceae bacterium]
DGNIGHEFVCTDQPFFSPVITTSDGVNTILNISAITYNTGLTSRYLFEEVHVNNGIGGVKKVLRVDERYESMTSAAVTDPNDIMKLTAYEYGDDYSGYSKRITAPSTNMELYADPNELPAGFTYHVSRIQNGVETKTTYNNEHLPIKTETIIKGETSAQDTQYAYEDITYDQYELPIKRERYSGAYIAETDEYNIESTEQFEYDSKGNLIKSWSVYADGEKNDEYATVYTYDSTYNLPLSVTYKRDADTTVTENYTLSTDKKTVTEKTVSENGALKEMTQYTYDTYGNVTKERKYKNATQYIDINYDYTDTAGATRPRNTSFSGAYLTKMWQAGGNDIDGNAIGNVEYTYQYDDMGNQTKVTDPLGNSTSYTYDQYRRLTRITNPDNTSQTFAYTLTTTANETLHTNEVGTQLKYVYDPAHNLLDILDITTGESLASYDYDQWYRKVAERNVQLEASSFETTYTYDIFNRVTQKETKSTWPDVATVAKETYSYDDGEISPYIITTHTIVGDNFAPSIVTKEYINKHGNVEKIGYVTGNNEYFTTYEYDYLGAKTEELAAIADQKDWTNEFTSKWDYDYAGRVLRQYNANNNFISYEYDWLGRVTKAYDAVANTLSTPYYTAYLYDDLGNVIQETIPQTATTNKVTKYKYDKLGRVILESRLHDILTGAEQYRSTSYEYDWRGNPTEVTQGGYFSTTYTYDDLGRLLSSTTDGKTTSYTYNRFGKVLTETFGGKTDTYEYDENMFRTKHIQPSGKIITYETNAIGQIAEIGATGESGTRTFEYTMTGQLLQASGGNAIGKILRKYDDRGNVIYEENTGLTKEYTYDISGKRESMIAEGSGDVQSLTYSYNRLEQLESVSGDTSAYYQYDANGNVIIAMENGHDEYSDYNRDNSPSYSTILYLGAGASSYNINYYLDGNIKSETFFDGTTK